MQIKVRRCKNKFEDINIYDILLIVKESQSQKQKRGGYMKISDVIEDFIKELFDDGEDYIEIQRNELAEKFNCVPSQINYVISTRFRPSQGYYVESRRRWWRKYKN